MFKLYLEKAEEEIKLAKSIRLSKKQESSRKNLFCLLLFTSITVYYIYYCLLTMPKSLTVWITINCGKFLKRWVYQATGPASWEICMQVKKQQLELHMEKQTGSK